jgi:hypothetical protein
MPGSINNGITAPPPSPELAPQGNSRDTANYNVQVRSSSAGIDPKQAMMAARNARKQIEVLQKREHRNSVVTVPARVEIDLDVPPLPMSPTGFSTYGIEQPKMPAIQEGDGSSTSSSHYTDALETLTSISLNTNGNGSDTVEDGFVDRRSSSLHEQNIPSETLKDKELPALPQGATIQTQLQPQKASSDDLNTKELPPLPAEAVMESNSAVKTSSGFGSYVRIPFIFRNLSAHFVEKQSADNRPFPKLHETKGLKQFCDNMRAHGIAVADLKDVKDAIDGIKPRANSSNLNTRAASIVKGRQTSSRLRIYELADELGASLKRNYTGSKSDPARDRAVAFVNKLVELSHENEKSMRVDALPRRKEELEFWLGVERELRGLGYDKQRIVAAREKFISQTSVLTLKEEHIEKLAEMCIETKKHLALARAATYDGDRVTQSLDDLINQYVTQRTETAKAKSNFPTDKVEDLRNAIDEIRTAQNFGQVDDIWSGYTGALGEISDTDLNAYNQAVGQMWNAFNSGWRRTWNTDEVNAAKNGLLNEAWPNETVNSAVAQRKDPLASPEKTTKFIDALAVSEANLRSAWDREAAIGEANKAAVKGKQVEGVNSSVTGMLKEDDAIKLREWMSKYLANAIEKMSN